MIETIIPAAIIALALWFARRHFKNGSKGMAWAWLACALLNSLYLARTLFSGIPL